MSQPTDKGTGRVGFRRGRNSNSWRALAIVVQLLFVTASYANAQIGSTTCTSPGIGLNECPSPQYRSGSTGDVFNYQTNTYNAQLTGNPVGDVNVLSSGTVSQLVLLTNTGLFASGGNGCQSPGAPLMPPSPTASPSIESRIIFPALVTDNSGTYCALYTYGLVDPGGPQFLNKLGATSPATYVSSSPGYNGNVVTAAENGKVYAYSFASNGPAAWIFTNPAPNPFSRGVPLPFDSSPAVWPNLNYVYVVDALGDIYYLDPGLGTPTYSITTQQIYPGGVNYQGASTAYTPSASSLAVSTSSNTLYVAGSAPTGNGVCAYNATDASYKWCNLGFGTSTCDLYSGTGPCYIISSPVVKDSPTMAYPLGLVYVQDSGATLYALDASNGKIAWMQQLPDLQGIADNPALVGASPAYDDSANNNTDKYVITTATLIPYCPGCRLRPSNNSMLYVFDATSGAPVCSSEIAHLSGTQITSVSNSSPEVVDGVIYIGTDDGYVLAYQEPPTCSGTNGTTLIPLWQSSTCPVGSPGYPCPMDSGLEGPPVVSFNRVHAVSRKGTLYIWHILGW